MKEKEKSGVVKNGELRCRDGERENREGSCSDVVLKITCGKRRGNRQGSQQNIT